MAMTPGGGGGGLQSEINVTPLVDVVLVLLIIFMVIMPLTMRGYDMNVPGPSVAAPTEGKVAEQVVLAIDATGCPIVEPLAGAGLPDDCRVRINDETLLVTELGQRVAEIFAARGPDDQVLFLAAQERLNYEGVMRIVDLARSRAKAVRIGMVAERGA